MGEFLKLPALFEFIVLSSAENSVDWVVCLDLNSRFLACAYLAYWRC